MKATGLRIKNRGIAAVFYADLVGAAGIELATPAVVLKTR